MAREIFVATTSGFVGGADGLEYQLSAGTTLVREGHPLLEGHADIFKPLRVHHEWHADEAPLEDATQNPATTPSVEGATQAPAGTPGVEQATRGPGEKRTIRRGDKSAGDAPDGA